MDISKMELTTQVYYGDGSLSKVGDLSKEYGENVLVISDEVIHKLGYADQVIRILEESGANVSVYFGANGEPTDVYVAEALKIAHDAHVNVIVCVGGGSALDTGKAVSVVATNGGYIGEYMDKEKSIPRSPIPLIAIPTTAGTGSEMTNVTVISDTKNNVKMMIKRHAFLPKAAIIDPRLTATSPRKVTAAAGMDALCHAIESYYSSLAHPLSILFSLDAAKLILNNLEDAWDVPDNVEAHTNMSLAATEAGIAFNNASVTLVHGMSRPIGALYHIAHGLSNTMLLPACLEYTKDYATDKLADIARLFLPENIANGKSNQELTDLLLIKVKAMSNHMQIPNLKNYGIKQADFEQNLDKMATDAINSGSPAYNPRTPTHDEIVELYRKCYNYDFSVTQEELIRIGENIQ